MKYTFFLALGVTTFCQSAVAESLGDAFERARGIIRDYKPSSSSSNSEHEREQRASPSGSGWTAPATVSESPEAIARRQERERIDSNLRSLEQRLSNAKSAPHTAKPTQREFSDFAISARLLQIEALMDSRTTSDSQEALRRSRAIRDFAFRNEQLVRSAMSRRQKPQFEALLNVYRFQRPVAYGLLPDQNRCALVLGMALGVEPEAPEESLFALSRVVDKQAAALNGVRTSEVAKRYYVSAQRLAERLSREWGAPIRIEGNNARSYLEGRRGVVFLQDAYFRTWRRSGDHIGLWNGSKLADPSTTPWERAGGIFFWELGK